MSGGIDICLEDYFANYDRVTQEKEIERRHLQTRRTALQNCLMTTAKTEYNGFKRMLKCRQTLHFPEAGCLPLSRNH